MKNLKEAYPGWLEKNCESLVDEELKRCNKFMDKVSEICAFFDNKERAKNEDPSSEKDQ